MRTFVPQTYPPSLNDKNFINVYYGGNNPCIVIGGQSNGCVLPNCVGYAFGRFMAILGSYPSLCTGNAGTWYGYNDGYKRGQTPQLGAVACWSYPGGAGHVAIVEKINPDGSIVCSESNYPTNSFLNRNPNFNFKYVPRLQYPYFTGVNESRYAPNYYSSAFHFQGFIYNPACAQVVAIESKLSGFIANVNDKIGDVHDWVCQETGLNVSQPWNAAYVAAVAGISEGILGEVIPKHTFNSVSAIARLGVRQNLGTWISSDSKPQVGDLLFTRCSSNILTSDKYTSDKVGIITDISDDQITCVMGDVNNRAEICKYSVGQVCINGYYRPNWETVGSHQSDLVYTPLYSEMNTREDAAIREIGYLDNHLEPSIISSNIELSVINYTGLVGGMYEFLGKQLGTDLDLNSGASNLDNLEQNCAICIQFFEDKGLTTAAAVGIAANIQAESRFRPDVVEKEWNPNSPNYGQELSFALAGVGLCQWTNTPRGNPQGRKTNMISAVGSDWRTNITGQLEFLWTELTSISAYAHLFVQLQQVKNNLSGAKDAAYFFLKDFERPGDLAGQTIVRQKNAENIWNNITIQQITTC